MIFIDKIYGYIQPKGEFMVSNVKIKMVELSQVSVEKHLQQLFPFYTKVEMQLMQPLRQHLYKE